MKIQDTQFTMQHSSILFWIIKLKCSDIMDTSATVNFLYFVTFLFEYSIWIEYWDNMNYIAKRLCVGCVCANAVHLNITSKAIYISYLRNGIYRCSIDRLYVHKIKQ